MPAPTKVKQPRSFSGLDGYLRSFVQHYSIIVAPLTDLLRNKSFSSNCKKKLPIEWSE